MSFRLSETGRSLAGSMCSIRPYIHSKTTGARPIRRPDALPLATKAYSTTALELIHPLGDRSGLGYTGRAPRGPRSYGWDPATLQLDDFAKFCWVRDESTFPILGPDFIDFDDWHLERIYEKAGALSDLYRKRNRVANPIFYDSFWRLYEDRAAVRALRDQKLPDILRQFKLIGHPDFWDSLLSKVHDLAVQAKFEAEVQAKKRALELAPIRAYARRAIYRKLGGSLAGIGNALRFNGIVDYVESHLKRTGKYPVGRHRVLYSSTIGNNRVQAPTSTLEVQFPDE